MGIWGMSGGCLGASGGCLGDVLEWFIDVLIAGLSVLDISVKRVRVEKATKLLGEASSHRVIGQHRAMASGQTKSWR